MSKTKKLFESLRKLNESEEFEGLEGTEINTVDEAVELVKQAASNCRFCSLSKIVETSKDEDSINVVALIRVDRKVTYEEFCEEFLECYKANVVFVRNFEDKIKEKFLECYFYWNYSEDEDTYYFSAESTYMERVSDLSANESKRRTIKSLNENESFYGIDIVPGIGGDDMGVYEGPDTKIKELHLIDFYDSFMDEIGLDYNEIPRDNILEWLKERYPSIVEHYGVKGDVHKGINDTYEAGYLVFTGDNKLFSFDPTDLIDFYIYDEEGSMGLGIPDNKNQEFYEALPYECKGWHALMMDE